jgi:hypothetical protein
MMNSADKTKKNWKEKIRHEFIEYWINVIYLTLVFASFTVHQRLVLATYDITYTNYGFAVIEALVLGKVIMVGDALHLGRGFETKPLIYPTLYKTVVFTIFVGIFKVIEHAIIVLWNGGAVTEIVVEISEQWLLEVIANSLVVFVAFIPFFAVKEIERMLGKGKVRRLFFRNRDDL